MENTVKTIRLAVAYENEYGRFLWNREWRIFTIEIENKDEENLTQFLDILYGEIHDFAQIVHSDPENEKARDSFIKRYEVQLFMSDSDTHIVMNQGEWDSRRVAMREMAERMLRDVLKEHPEMIEDIPPEMRHRFQNR